MADEGERALERVGRPRRPAVWIGAWAVGLSAVVALAIVGSRPSESLPGSPEAGIVAASAGVAASPGSPTSVSSRLPRLRPLPSRPPLGEDGLMGGIVFGTAWPPE